MNTSPSPPLNDDDGIWLQWAQEHAAFLIFATFMCLLQVMVALFYCYSTGTFPLKEKILLRADELSRAREERIRRQQHQRHHHHHHPRMPVNNVVYPIIDLASTQQQQNPPIY
jgi:hypothetical protein